MTRIAQGHRCRKRWLLAGGLLAGIVTNLGADIATPEQSCMVGRMAVCEINGVRVYQDTPCPSGSVTIKPLEVRDCTHAHGPAPMAPAVIPPNAGQPETARPAGYLPWLWWCGGIAALLVIGLTLQDAWRARRQRRLAARETDNASPPQSARPGMTPAACRAQSEPATQLCCPAVVLWLLSVVIGLWGATRLSGQIFHRLFDGMNHDSFAGLLSVLPQVLGVFAGSFAGITLLSAWVLYKICRKKAVQAAPSLDTQPETGMTARPSPAQVARKRNGPHR